MDANKIYDEVCVCVYIHIIYALVKDGRFVDAKKYTMKYVCLCVYVYVCMYVCIDPYKHILCAYIQKFVDIKKLYDEVCTYIYIHTYVHKYILARMYMYTYTYIWQVITRNPKRPYIHIKY